MAYKVHYEFIVEQLDNDPEDPTDPDIIDTSAFDTLAEASEFAASITDLPWRIGLTRNEGNDVEGLVDRAWAYPGPDGKLPDHFNYGAGEEGPAVPKRFRGLVFPVQ